MQTGGTNPKKKERLTNRSEKVMKKAVKNWEFARDVSASGTTNKGELDVAEAMQNKAQRQGERAKKIRAKAEKYQVGGVTNAGSDSIKAKAAAAAKAKAMKAMKTTGSKVGKMGTDTAKKYQRGGRTKEMPIKSKPLDSNQVYRSKKLSPAGAKEYMRKYGRPTKKMQMGGPSMYQGPVAAQQPTEDMAMDMNMNPMAQRQSSYKIGGMVNPNSNVSKQTVPGSRGVKSGVNPKAAASKVARGTVGGTSTAPSKAIPKAQMGMGLKSSGVSRGKGNWMIDKPYERGVMGAGNSATKTTRSGDVKRTKTVTGGGMYPGSKGSITKTKTVGSDRSAWLKNPNKPDGTVVKSKTKEISNSRANRIINRKAQTGGAAYYPGKETPASNARDMGFVPATKQMKRKAERGYKRMVKKYNKKGMA